MNDISVKIPFDSSNERILAATKELASEIYRSCLGRKPNKNDEARFRQRINPGNKSINDQYFDDRKVGSLMITYVLDMPRCIVLGFKPARR